MDMATLTEDCDRISSLPDSILYPILSHLPTKLVVQASVLSKRWKDLWFSLPYLNFEASKEITDDSDKWQGFINFVDRVLLYHDNSRIISFRLRLLARSITHVKCKDSHINTWISAAARAGVQELDICSKFNYAYSLRSLFLCNSLVILKLEFHTRSEFPKLFSFPKLKSMYLFNVRVAKNFSDELLNYMPNLETFLFFGKWGDGDDISYPFPRVAGKSGHKRLNCPNLDTFLFSQAEDMHSKTSPSVETAFIGLPNQTESTAFSVTRFIRKIRSAENLCLSHSCIKLLKPKIKRSKFYFRPSFYRLKRVELWLDIDEGDVEVMSHLLQWNPIVESIVIRSLDFRPILFERKRMNLTMLGFCGEKSQVELLKLLMQKGKLIVVKLEFDLVSSLEGLSHLQQQQQVKIKKVGPKEYHVYKRIPKPMNRYFFLRG